jgi:hypothetical protein
LSSKISIPGFGLPSLGWIDLISSREERMKRKADDSKRPHFYLTDKEKKDGETSRIQKWLALADSLFDSNDDADPTLSPA